MVRQLYWRMLDVIQQRVRTSVMIEPVHEIKAFVLYILITSILFFARLIYKVSPKMP